MHFPYTMMFYESPSRLVQPLEDCRDAFGPDRPAVVVRELTKKFEEFNRGSLDDLAVHFDQNGQIKGEICYYIAGRSEEHTSELQSRFDLVCRLLLEKKKFYEN